MIRMKSIDLKGPAYTSTRAYLVHTYTQTQTTYQRKHNIHTEDLASEKSTSSSPTKKHKQTDQISSKVQKVEEEIEKTRSESIPTSNRPKS